MNPINNAIYLRRRSKICLPAPGGTESLPLHYVASLLKNIETLGFTFSQPLITACRDLSLPQLTTLYQELLVLLRRVKGAHQTHAPMYPNFPAQVMEADEAELYLNAIVHLPDGRQIISVHANKRTAAPAGQRGNGGNTGY